MDFDDCLFDEEKKPEEKTQHTTQHLYSPKQCPPQVIIILQNI